MPWVGGSVLLFVAAGLLLYGSTGVDDTHITYWAAHTLAEFGEILNYNGVRLEQSSTLFHTVLLAAARTLVPVRLATLGPVMSVLGGAVTVASVYVLGRRLRLDRPGVASLFCALLAYLVYWSFSGMETSWAAALTVGTVWAAHRWICRPTALRWTILFAVLLAFVSIRPEAGFIALSAFAGYAVLRAATAALADSGSDGAGGISRPVRRPLALLATAGGAFGALTAARLLYFGSVFPAPVTAKVSGVGLRRVAAGWDYVLRHGLTPSLLFLAGMGLVALWEGRSDADDRARLRLLLLSFAAAVVAFCVASGGDWMEGGRFLVPALPLVALLGTEGILRIGRRRAVVVGATALLLVGDALLLGYHSSMGDPAPVASETYAPVLEKAGAGSSFSWWEKANRIHLRDILLIEWVRGFMEELPASSRPLTVWSGQAGMVYYHLAREYHPGGLHFVDLRGLTTRQLRDCDIGVGQRGTVVGIQSTYRELLGLDPAAGERCRIPRPDLVVDINPDHHKRDVLVEHGYRVLYRQSGRIPPAVDGYGRVIPTSAAEAFVAVRESLVEESREREVLRYP